MKREDFRNKSYWLSSRDYQPNPGLSGDVKVDVAIVGGGFSRNEITGPFYGLRKTDFSG